MEDLSYAYSSGHSWFGKGGKGLDRSAVTTDNVSARPYLRHKCLGGLAIFSQILCGVLVQVDEGAGEAVFFFDESV